MATAEELVPFVQSAQVVEMDKKLLDLERQVHSFKHVDSATENSGSGRQHSHASSSRG